MHDLVSLCLSCHAQMPPLPFGAGGGCGLFSVRGEGTGERKLCHGHSIHPSARCMPCPVLVSGGLGVEPSLLLTLADSSSFSPQTQAPPCLQTPQPRAQAQSPLCHLHSEEPARHLSPSPHGDPGSRNSPPPTIGTLPQPRVHHYVRKSPPAPPVLPPCLSGMILISEYSRTCLKDVSNG